MGYYGWRGRFFEVDPGEVGIAEAICDRCGFRFNLKNMQWQYDYRGSATMQNTRVMVCGRPSCLDIPNVQISPLILEADPAPLANARPEPYTIDETNWLTTQDGNILTTQDDDRFTTSIPNPSSNAATAYLNTLIRAPGGSVATTYLDIFNGNPLGSGVSVLASITGTATRTNIASLLETAAGVAVNPARIIVALESGATVNTNYIGIYDAATAGTLLMSGPAWVNGQIVTEGNPVVFDPLAININLN